jgi:AcrR family transcriptional regulator
VADAAGISEAVLYQRFGNKDDLFFAAMRPPPPDVDRLLGPADPPDDAQKYLRDVTVRLGRHFAEMIPLGLRLMTHPAFELSRLGPTPPGGPTALRDGLAARLDSLARRGALGTTATGPVARLLIALAHDWGLGAAMGPSRPAAARERELREMVDAVWAGLRPG